MSDTKANPPENAASAVTPKQAEPVAKPKAVARAKAPARVRTPPAKAASAPATPSTPPALTETIAPAVAAAATTTAKVKSARRNSPAREKKTAAKKPKLVRDSFTFPEAEYAVLGTLKQKLLAVGIEVKKTELLRAGLAVLSQMSAENLLLALNGVSKLKPGRPAR